ncbi:hypothetical protein LTS02_016718 [Friedmanniomyces endolithicus]|nr:hypothetical protein LTS02_016718 [Friedmanniomyces endolithicus]
MDNFTLADAAEKASNAVIQIFGQYCASTMDVEDGRGSDVESFNALFLQYLDQVQAKTIDAQARTALYPPPRGAMLMWNDFASLSSERLIEPYRLMNNSNHPGVFLNEMLGSDIADTTKSLGYPDTPLHLDDIMPDDNAVLSSRTSSSSLSGPEGQPADRTILPRGNIPKGRGIQSRCSSRSTFLPDETDCVSVLESHVEEQPPASGPGPMSVDSSRSTAISAPLQIPQPEHHSPYSPAAKDTRRRSNICTTTTAAVPSVRMRCSVNYLQQPWNPAIFGQTVARRALKDLEVPRISDIIQFIGDSECVIALLKLFREGRAGERRDCTFLRDDSIRDIYDRIKKRDDMIGFLGLQQMWDLMILFEQSQFKGCQQLSRTFRSANLLGQSSKRGPGNRHNADKARALDHMMQAIMPNCEPHAEEYEAEKRRARRYQIWGGRLSDCAERFGRASIGLVFVACSREREVLRWRHHLLFVMSEQDFEWLLNVLDEIQGNYLRELSNKLATLFEDTGAANSISILDASREADFLACPKGTRKLLSMLFS